MQINYNSGKMPSYLNLVKTATQYKSLSYSILKRNSFPSQIFNLCSIQGKLLASESSVPSHTNSYLHSVLLKSLPRQSSLGFCISTSFSKCKQESHAVAHKRSSLPRAPNIVLFHLNSENPDKSSNSYDKNKKAWFHNSSGSSFFNKGFSFHFYNSSSSLPRVGDLYLRALHDAKFSESFPPDAENVVRETAKDKEEKLDHEKGSTTPTVTLRLYSGACSLPHPAKADRGGEDAHFICTQANAVGVADGVGGWADMGIDAGLYARELMTESANALCEEIQGPIDPARILTTAHSRTKCQGSSTACILVLSGDKLQAANLGDSGFTVIRNGRVLFKSPSQQHDFNFPYQLGSEGSDPPEVAEVFDLPVTAGDVVVAGTDGLFDNVFDNELTSVVMHSLKSGSSPKATAEKVAALARVRAQDRMRISPFSVAAQEAGWLFIGGKLDDITVVVSYITPAQ